MKKYINILIITLSVYGTISSQQSFRERREIQWSSVQVKPNISATETVNIFEINNGENRPNSFEIPFYSEIIPVAFNGKVSVEIRPIATSPIVITNTSNPNIKDVFYGTGDVHQNRSAFEAAIYVFPVRKTSSGYERLDAFEIEYTITPEASSGLRGPEPTTHSMLETGEIYKISVTQTGIYKIGKAMFDQLGINISSLNPDLVKIYSRPGGMLTEKIEDVIHDDLVEIPLVFIGGEDGKFDDADYFMCYIEGPDEWKYFSSDSDHKISKNIYDIKNFAFIKINGEQGKRIQKIEITGEASFITDSYNDFQVFEEDKYNVLGNNPSTAGSGKLWIGEAYSNAEEKNYTPQFDFNNLKPNQNSVVSLSFYGRSETSGKLQLTVNGKAFSKNLSSVLLGEVETTHASSAKFNEKIVLNATGNEILLKYTGNSTNAQGWLDQITLNLIKTVNFNAKALILRNNQFATATISEMQGNFGQAFVWDVSKLDNIIEYKHQPTSVKFSSGFVGQKLMVFDLSTLLSAKAEGKVANQNYHSIGRADMVVLYPEVFKDAAQRFITHRSAYNNIIVEGVEISKLYNEFSSGRQDPTAIRDFARMLHKRDPQFRYMLFMGDGSYDQRQITPGLADTRFIPVYETDASLHPTFAFPTDDYFALLSDKEGSGLGGALDIAIGRLPVKTEEEANALVDKIIYYDTSPDRFGAWRLKVGYSADDEDNNEHFRQADEIARKSFTQFPNINQQKVYIDAYKQQITPGGTRFPDATNDLNANMDNGQLVLSYLGHGGPGGWAQERILKVSDINSWTNKNALALIVTATCSFSGYDDPSIVSAGEHCLLNEKGGAIALFSTVRAVYSTQNKVLTENVYANLFQKVNGKIQTLGEIVTKAKNTKQDTTGENSRKFTLLGDPSQYLAFPEYNIEIKSINGISPESFKDTIGAMQKVIIAGEILDNNNQLLSNFNGKIYPTVFDKASTLQTLGNDDTSIPTKFTAYKNVIYKGVASVQNGKFTFEFIVPKDINYEIGKARISLYATDQQSTDAAGNYNGLTIGGSGDNGIVDDQKPNIEVYINDESFVFGGITNESPTLLIKAKDDYGINVTGTSIGHDLTATITGPESSKYVLNEYFESNLNDYKEGSARFPLKDLPTGTYTVKAKVWDVANNTNEGTTEFMVVNGEDVKLQNVYNFPNPFSTNTRFTFEHDMAGQQSRVVVNIYTVTGKIVKSVEQSLTFSGNRCFELNWDGKDDFGQKLGRGVYLYKIKVYSDSLGLSRESDFSKLVVL